MKTSNNFKYGRMSFDKNILYISYKPNTLMDENLLMEQIKCRKELCGNEPYYMIVDLCNTIDVTLGAMVLAAENPSPKGIRAIALITNNGLDHTRAKMYAVFDRPAITTKAFLTTGDARLWFDILDQSGDLRKTG